MRTIWIERALIIFNIYGLITSWYILSSFLQELFALLFAFRCIAPWVQLFKLPFISQMQEKKSDLARMRNTRVCFRELLSMNQRRPHHLSSQFSSLKEKYSPNDSICNMMLNPFIKKWCAVRKWRLEQVTNRLFRFRHFLRDLHTISVDVSIGFKRSPHPM